MKTCPVCHAVAFDDAAICYGCLYRFDEREEGLFGDELIDSASSGFFGDADDGAGAGVGDDAGTGDDAANDASDASSCMQRGTPPTFLVRFTPVMESSGDVVWTCAIEHESVPSCH